MNKAKSIIDILDWRARKQTHQLAYRFLLDDVNDAIVCSYAELDRKARCIARNLQSITEPGDRVLLLFPPGLDFIFAYFGCLYAKVIAVPAYPPHPRRLERTLPMIRGIIKDASPKAALVTKTLYDVINSKTTVASEFPEINWSSTDVNANEPSYVDSEPPQCSTEDLAFIQYTSGSTDDPKGVMVSHGNILDNLGHIEKEFDLSAESNAVFWLPPYHDMGLIGGILQALYTGYPLTLLSHFSFLQKPYRWLQAISQFQANVSGAPNFGYDLCTKKIKPEQLDSLDLSRWRVAFNGAEKVHYETMTNFADYFQSCGFNKKAFSPCYGLAEATLMVTGGLYDRLPLTKNLVTSKLRQDKVRISSNNDADATKIVGCGHVSSNQKVLIVNPDTLEQCQADEIGEIWVSGKNKTQGYWNEPEETERTFNAQLSNGDNGAFLRTGDLGFITQRELFITGRIKDLIISGGNNHYPNDIEKTIEMSFPASNTLRGVAFSIQVDEEEKLVILVELNHKLVEKVELIKKTIIKSVTEKHELHIHDIRFIQLGELRRTSSGKLKRYLCRKHYLEGKFNEIS